MGDIWVLWSADKGFDLRDIQELGLLQADTT